MGGAERARDLGEALVPAEPEVHESGGLAQLLEGLGQYAHSPDIKELPAVGTGALWLLLQADDLD